MALQSRGHSSNGTVAFLRGCGVRHPRIGRLVQSPATHGADWRHPAGGSRTTLLRLAENPALWRNSDQLASSKAGAVQDPFVYKFSVVHGVTILGFCFNFLRASVA